MKLNRISSALRVNKNIKTKGKAALVTSAFLTLLNATAYAEEAPATEAAVEVSENARDEGRSIEIENDLGDVEVIEVRGMRGTMTRSLNEKKNNTAIVDAIAAADFGDLPGLSLSDVIENISGASGHRLKGSQNEIAIRGLGSYWGYSTFNGRTITNAGPGRAVNFKKFPSELVDKVTIYKTQQANLAEGGTSGTIEVGSVRAVDYGKSKTSVEIQGQYNDYYTEADNQSPWGGKFTVSTIQNFETENFGDLGFSLGYVQSSSANPEENYGASTSLAACSFKAADGSPLTSGSDSTFCGDRKVQPDSMVSPGRSQDLVTLGPNADADVYGPNGQTHLESFDQDSIFFIPEDSYWRATDDKDERQNIVGTFQWVPNDEWDINLDYAYSDIEYTENRMEIAQQRGKNLNSETLIFDDKGNLLYEEGEGRTTLQGENRNQVDEFNGGGINIAYAATDNLVLTADFSYNKSYRYRLRNRAKFRHEDNIAYSIDSRGTVPKLILGDTEEVENADFYYENVNGQLVKNEDYDPSSVFDVSDINSFLDDDGGAYLEYSRQNNHREDENTAFKFDAEYIIDDNVIFSGIDAGIRYSTQTLYDYSEIDNSLNELTGEHNGIDRAWKSSDGFDETDEWYNATARAVECGSNGHNLDGFLKTGGGPGNAENFFTFDAKCMTGAYLGSVAGNAPDVGFYDIGENPDQRDGDLVDVTENITAVYAMANIDTEIGSLPVTGNIGLRFVRTETESQSWGDKAVLTQSFDAVDDPETEEDETGGENWSYSSQTSEVFLEDSYDEWLPSLNLTFHLSDEWLLRTSAYRSMSRFSLNSMSAGQTITHCDTVESEGETTCNNYEEQLVNGFAEGNMMNPYMANNYDVSIEWYPSLDMAVTLGTYWKDFEGGTELIIENRVPDVTKVLADGTTTEEPYSNAIPYSVNQVITDTSTIKGFELTFQKHFAELPGVFSGIGIKGAWNHAVSDFNSEEPANWGISPDANINGFSKNVASGSIYWEGDDLSMRLMYKYRSRYFQPNNLPFPHKGNRWVEDSDYVDAAVKYKIGKHFEVSLKALNLLAEDQIYTRGPGTVTDYSHSGRKFFVGVKAKF